MVGRLGVWSVALLLWSGCAGVVLKKGPAFKNSSLDYNGQQMHSVELQGDVEPVLEAVTTSMTERGARLLRRSTINGHPVLVFRVSADAGSTAVARGYYRVPRKQVSVSVRRYRVTTKVSALSYGSIFYFEAQSSGSATVLRALGVPTVSNIVACPELAHRFTACAPYTLEQEVAPGDAAQSVPQLVNDEVGVSVSGNTEAEVLNGLFAELQGFKWQKFLRESQTPQEAPKSNIDNAFDAPQVDQL
jgi:hypothetical protein